RCPVNKTKGSSSGSFSVTLKRGKERKNGIQLTSDVNYLELVHPGDWVAIYIRKSGPIPESNLKRTGKNSGLKMVGIVENVRYVEVEDPATGAPRLEFLITGRDFGKVLDSNI